MTKNDEMVIDGETYVRKGTLPTPSGAIRIVILQRGWVKVGYFSQDGEICKLERCATIRLWGTTKGLGEIATGGPTAKTVLDKEPTCRFHILTTLAILDCVEEKWQIALS